MFFIVQVIDEGKETEQLGVVSKHGTRPEAEAAVVVVAKSATGTFYVVKALARVRVDPTLETLP